MTIRAENDPKFYFRFKLIGVVAIGFALWCLYDGLVKYPQQQERALAFHELVVEERIDEWDEYAEERGWPADIIPDEPKEQEEFNTSIIEQYVMGAVAGAVGLLALLAVWRARSRWIEATDTGITSSWGQTLDFNEIVSLDKRQWRGKGIAKAYYQDGGRRKRFVIDDFKFQREPTDAILRLLESKIDVDKITGGPPESTGEEDVAASADSVPEPSGDLR